MRKTVIKVLSAVVSLVMVIVLAFGAALSPEPVQAAPAPQCIVQVQGTVGLVVCAGLPIVQVPLPTVQVSGPTISLPPVTLPPITLPAETVTVQIPGGTETVTQTVNVLETETLEPSVTVDNTDSLSNDTPSVLPQPTVSASETGQNPPGDGTIGTEDDPPNVDLGDGKTTIVEVGLGLLATVGIVALIVLALWTGYYIGYKDKEKNDTSFMRSVLEQAKLTRGKHS